jgi:hypothetical protein
MKLSIPSEPLLPSMLQAFNFVASKFAFALVSTFEVTTYQASVVPPLI